ncbi:MAG TPA: PspC domain-containing protein [Chloroflexota bacterium]|jgi:phage shock protein C|nr:PspC domain-containing protein [Chloroflexota bacterium]
MTKKLFRSRENRMLAGVCGGVGEYLGIDPTIVRLLWVGAVLLGFVPAFVAYLLAWAIVPDEPVIV